MLIAPSRSTLRIVTIALSFWLASNAAAQTVPVRPLGGESPTQGIRIHAPRLVGEIDASAVELNPGALGTLSAWSVYLQHSEMQNDGRVGGTGDAVLAAAPFPWYRPLVFGVGFQWMRPPEAIGYANAVKLSLAAAWRPISSFSIGLAVHTLVSDSDPNLRGLTSLDIGATFRPFEWMGLGLVVRDLNTPLYDELPIQRSYDLDIAFRPLGNDRLEIVPGLRIGERRGEIDPHLRIEGTPLEGLSIFAHGELLRRDFYRGDAFHANDPTDTDVRVTLGARISLERISMAFSALIARSLPTGAPGHPMGAENATDIYQGAAVSLAFSGTKRAPLVEIGRKLVWLNLRGKCNQQKMVDLFEIFEVIQQREDVAGVALHIDGLQLGWAQAQDLRQHLQRLRDAGKSTFAYLRAPSAKEYYVASAAQRVLLDPAGGIHLQGMSMATLHFRSLFDKVGINPQFVKIAEFKSAPESFTETKPTADAKKMREALLGDLYQQLVSDIAKSRHRDPGKLRATIDQGPFVPPDAKAGGLVDELVPPDKIQERLAKLGKAKIVKPGSLWRSDGRWPVGPAIAVLAIEGDIVRGKSKTIPLIGKKTVGDKTIVGALARIRADSKIKAVVVRINSPGGSAMASDHIWREIMRVKKVKPVIISMADVAASGGYYAASAGHVIFAQPGTITGSIGIFSGKFDFSGLMEKIGLTTDVSSKGKRANLNRFDRPYTKEERSFLLKNLRYYYNQFLDAVGQSRKMKRKAVDAVARGRVWTGRQAKAHKLIDRYGGLSDALIEARKRAGLAHRPHRLLTMPRPKQSWLKKVMKFFVRADTPVVPAAFTRVIQAIPAVLFATQSGEPLARLPFNIIDQ
jgi:protease IV